jgi:hypothetical protein
MQFESWEDAVKKAKAKAVEDSPNFVPDPDPVQSTVESARSGLALKASAIALFVLVAFDLGFLPSSFLRAGSGVRPAVGIQSSLRAPDPGAIVQAVSAPRYTILKFDGDHVNRFRKDIYAVRLREKVTKDVLSGIAYELRRKGPPEKERTVIRFYLPVVDAFGEGPFGPPWALADFNGPFSPGLKIDIYGLDAKQEAKLVASPIPPDREVIGRWIEDFNGGEGLYTIYRKDGALYLETHGGHPRSLSV